MYWGLAVPASSHPPDALVEGFCRDWIPIQTFLLPNELGAAVYEAVEAAKPGCQPVGEGEGMSVDWPALAQPQPKRTKYAFAGNVDMPQAASTKYEGWAAWTDFTEATFRVFIGDDQVAKIAGASAAMAGTTAPELL